MKTQSHLLPRVAAILCVALALAVVSAATNWSGTGTSNSQDAVDGASAAHPQTPQDVTAEELPVPIRKALLANRAISDFLEKNDDMLFRVFHLGATTGIKHVTFWLKHKEVGYAMLQRDVISIGSIGDIGFDHDKKTGRVTFKRSDAAGVWTKFEYAKRAERADEAKTDDTAKPDDSHAITQTQADDRAEPAVGQAKNSKAAAAKPARPKPRSIKATRIIPPLPEPVVKSRDVKEIPSGAPARIMQELAGRKQAVETAPVKSEDSQRTAAPPVKQPVAVNAAAAQTEHDVTPMDSGGADRSGSALVTPSTDSPSAGVWLPITGGRGLMWISIVFVLTLMLRTNRWFSLRNLDAVVLAGTCVLLAMRTAASPADAMRWWSYLLLTVAAGYWLIRGVLLTRARSTPFYGSNVSGGGMLVMLLFALSVAVTTVATAPISRASRDAIIGGQYMATTGKLPAGRTVGADARSPLLYILHAAAIKTSPATVYTPDGNALTPEWAGRDSWMQGNWWESADFSAARLVNGLLLIATVVALFVIGRALHSTAIGLAMAAVFCIFPGTVECLGRPDVMLATALISWSIAFATLQRGAGLGATFFMVLAGLAWPWAWLAVPVLVGYYLRRGWDGLGSVAGVIGGAALLAFAMPWLAVPTIPRADGAVAAAGLQVKYQAGMTDDTLKIDRLAAEPPAAADQWIARQKRELWSFLINDGCTIADGNLATSHPGLNARDVAYYQLRSDPAVARLIQEDYEQPTSKLPLAFRLKNSFRTLLEATWLPVNRQPSAMASTWDVWAGGAVTADDWVTYRRAAKVGVLLIAMFVAFVLLFGGGRRTHQLLGGLLAVMVGGLLVGMSGPITGLARIMPVVLALMAVNFSEAPRVVSEQMPRPIRLGAEPRISVER